MIDWSEYRTEMLLAINEHVESAEKAAMDGRSKSDVLMYCNKCLALLQFGRKAKLVTEKEWHDNYERLSISIAAVKDA